MVLNCLDCKSLIFWMSTCFICKPFFSCILFSFQHPDRNSKWIFIISGLYLYSSSMICFLVCLISKNLAFFSRSKLIGLNNVRREIVFYVTIVFYDKVRGRNKAQRWLLLVCCRFFFWKRYNRTHFHRTILWLT